MKTAIKILIILTAFVGSTFAQTVTPCGISTPSCQNFVNGDNQNINKTLLSIGQTIANSATIAPSTTTLNTIYNQYQNGKLDSLRQKLDTALQSARYILNNVITGTMTIASTSATASGTVAAGESSVSFETSSDFVGDIDGVSALASNSYTYSAPRNKVLPQIVFTITAGNIKIRKMKN